MLKNHSVHIIATYALLILAAPLIFASMASAQAVNCPVGFTCTPINSSTQSNTFNNGYYYSGGGFTGTTQVPPAASNAYTPTPTVSQVAPTNCYFFGTNLTVGSRGTDVSTLQRFLISKGYILYGATGYFGQQTAAALRQYQATNGINENGFFGPLTRAHVNQSRSCSGGEDRVVCTQDVMACGDGSYVSRDPNNSCQFRSCPDNQNRQSSITVLSPNGGETYRAGDIVEIRWNSAGVPIDYSKADTIKIELGYMHNDPAYGAGQYFEDWIVERTANTGSYRWVIPEYYANGVQQSSFKVKVGGGGVSDYSNAAFTILPGVVQRANISVSSPVSGSSYRAGSVVPITWRRTSTEGYSASLLRYNDPSFLRLSLNTTGYAPSLGWIVPDGLPSGNDYFIKVNEGTYRNDTGYSGQFTISGSASSLTDLVLKSVTKGNFHPYGFHMNICMNGSKSINDLKRENPSIRSFPIEISTYDLWGNQYKTDASATGGIEDLKNGQCIGDASSGLGVTLQANQYSAYDQTKKAGFTLDPSNLIQETNENNNSYTLVESTTQPAISDVTASQSYSGGPVTLNIRGSRLNGGTINYNEIIYVDGQQVNVGIVSQSMDGTSMVVTVPTLTSTSHNLKVVYTSGLNTGPSNIAYFTFTGSAQTPVISVTSPWSGGEKLTMGTDYTIRWTDSYGGAARYTVYIVQQNGNGYGIAGNDVYGTSFVWRVGSLIPGTNNGQTLTPGNTYYVQVVRQTLPSVASSNAPFYLVSSPTASTDLYIKNLTKAGFHEYGFYAEVCMNGSKSINDLKRENPSLNGYPMDIVAYDSYGREYRENASGGGGIEDLKNGECFNAPA